ncbi:hypothetical protein WG66_013408 [Moniliophthora roreri]|uniref:PWWP domain-containing protein n=1 Tax=Moniliophthora roreri TaxID=221103 RepID=A0A0W0F2Q7_MONRR|nr:hypothetical protein WG66_013408 [Moniliophthora roreri]
MASSKKGGKKETVAASYSVKDIVLGKVRGFPPWPGQVVEPDTAPPSVLRERPSNKKTTFYCVQFFPTGDYAWLPPKDISRLQKHEIEAYINEPYKKSGDLLTGYRIAMDPTKWEETRAAEMADAAADDDEEEETGAGEVDELASGDEDGSKGKKRKKSAASASGAVKKRKREDSASASVGPKGGKKKGESASAAGSKKAPKGGKKSASSKNKAMVESEDEVGADGADAAGTSKKAGSPPAKKAKKGEGEESSNDPEANKVREWRHRLQKTFLSNKGPPKETDMPAMNELFTQIETYEQMTVHQLSFSKIGKVMRHIAALDTNKSPIPREDEFRFRERAKVLVDKWHSILGSKEGKEKENGVNGVDANGAAHTTNGDTADADGDADPAPTNTNANTEDKDVPMTNGIEAGDMSALADVTMSEADA